MSRRKAPTLATLADNAAAGRRVVASSGSMDGALLLALAKLQLVPNGTIGDQASTWAPGITSHNAQSQMPEPSDNHPLSLGKQGAKHGDSTD